MTRFGDKLILLREPKRIMQQKLRMIIAVNYDSSNFHSL